MTYRLEILSAAEAENAEVVRRLLEQGELEAAQRYATEISHAIEQIWVLPLAWPQHPTHPDFRIRHVRQVSYSIIFRVRDHIITIVAFAHMHRSRDYWRARVR